MLVKIKVYLVTAILQESYLRHLQYPSPPKFLIAPRPRLESPMPGVLLVQMLMTQQVLLAMHVQAFMHISEQHILF